jgi:hypothetical protein
VKKIVNVIDSKTGAPLRDPKSGKLLRREVAMTAKEVAAFEAERAAQQGGSKQ